jgi:hypothetical protein
MYIKVLHFYHFDNPTPPDTTIYECKTFALPLTEEQILLDVSEPTFQTIPVHLPPETEESIEVYVMSATGQTIDSYKFGKQLR